MATLKLLHRQWPGKAIDIRLHPIGKVSFIEAVPLPHRRGARIGCGNIIAGHVQAFRPVCMLA